MEVTLLVVAWAVTMLCGTGGLLALFHRLDILKRKIDSIEQGTSRVRTWQMEADLKHITAHEMAQLPPVPERNETAFTLGRKQVFRLSRERQGRAQ